MEPPPHFEVLADGTVIVGTTAYSPQKSEDAQKLEEAINQRYSAAASAKKGYAPDQKSAAAVESEQLYFKVSLRLGILYIECWSGKKLVDEAGLRGIRSLIDNGYLRRPKSQYEVGPMQGWVEFDGERFAATEKGAQDLEIFLNKSYRPEKENIGEKIIKINTDSASRTGFNIRFSYISAGGIMIQVSGHLDPEKLILLVEKSGLLQDRVVLRMQSPYLYARKRRPDGGDDPIPGLRDIKYLGAVPQALQAFFNHPNVNRYAASAAS